MSMKQRLVLYVDDEPDALVALKIGLEGKGYAVLTAESGEKALESLSSQIPDVVIADLRMSPMNGFDLYQQVRKIPRMAHIPFFFLTAVDDYLAQKYGRSLGVDAYLTKPVDVDTIDKAIQRKLNK